METKKYSSFEQIEVELEILKLERELSFQKMLWNGQKIKESFTLPNLATGFLGSYKSILSNSYNTVLQNVIPVVIRILSNIKKRGD
jgi:hypothetical protein